MRKRDIKGKIRSIIRSCDWLDYYYCCTLKRKDKKFSDYARDRSSEIVRINQGELSPDGRIVYYIYTGNAFSGFGAAFRRTLDAIFFADHYGFIPVIEYTDQYIYAEKHPVDGITNPFEYYFMQPGGEINPENVQLYMHVKFSEEHRNLVMERCNVSDSYEVSEEYLQVMGDMIQKYIRLRPQVQEYMTEMLAHIRRSGTMIGVHFRGTDFSVGYKNHPKALGLNDYFEKIDELLEQTQDASIFLATDDKGALDAFCQRYGDRIVFYEDTFRSVDSSPVHFSANERENHKYKLGIEILRDILSLADCDYLVSGLSQVSYCARYFKYSTGRDYTKKVILTMGLYK